MKYTVSIQEQWEHYVQCSKEKYDFPESIWRFLNFTIQSVEIVDSELGIAEIKIQNDKNAYTLSSYEQWLINQTMTCSDLFSINLAQEELLEKLLHEFGFIEKIIPEIEANKEQMIEKWNRIHKKVFKKVRLIMIVEMPIQMVECIESLYFHEAFWINKNKRYRYFEIKARNNEGLIVYKKDENYNDFSELPPSLEPLRENLRKEFVNYIEKLGLEKFIRFFEQESKIWKKENPSIA